MQQRTMFELVLLVSYDEIGSVVPIIHEGMIRIEKGTHNHNWGLFADEFDLYPVLALYSPRRSVLSIESIGWLSYAGVQVYNSMAPNTC
jgi:hypothetical protein